MLPVLCVNRESSVNLELTRSGKEQWDERIMQTLRLFSGKSSSIKHSKPEDLPEYVAFGFYHRVLLIEPAASFVYYGCFKND